MQGLGMIEGRDFVLEERYGEGDEARLPSLAADLIALQVRVIVATSQPSIAAAWRVTKSVPVIGRMVDDPVTDGMAQSLARPGGNVTGVYTMTEEMNPKRLALLKEVAPEVRRVGVLLRQDFPSENIAKHDWQNAESAAHQLELELFALNVRTADEITTAFDQASTNGVQGIVTFRNPTVVTYLDLIASLSRQRRLPTVFDAREYVEAGGLLSYGPNIDRTYRQLATYAYKLLRGTPVSNLPIEQPTTFELVVNKRTAGDIGISISSGLLTRADKVIE
jgi:putative ABC transport system substrate-binding protein